MTQMDGVTQQNAALVEEAAAAAQSLREQADHLTEVVGVFALAGGRHAPIRSEPRLAPVVQLEPNRGALPVARRAVR
jgi:methyl-accepting chemotaxis protein